jgi:hypothetical protein
MVSVSYLMTEKASTMATALEKSASWNQFQGYMAGGGCSQKELGAVWRAYRAQEEAKAEVQAEAEAEAVLYAYKAQKEAEAVAAAAAAAEAEAAWHAYRAQKEAEAAAEAEVEKQTVLYDAWSKSDTWNQFRGNMAGAGYSQQELGVIWRMLQEEHA